MTALCPHFLHAAGMIEADKERSAEVWISWLPPHCHLLSPSPAGALYVSVVSATSLSPVVFLVLRVSLSFPPCQYLSESEAAASSAPCSRHSVVTLLSAAPDLFLFFSPLQFAEQKVAPLCFIENGGS